MIRLLLAALALTVASACGGSAVDKSKCMQGQVHTRYVLAGPSTSPGYTALKAAFVKSPDHPRLYFIAVKFRGDGVPEQTGVWASELDDPYSAEFPHTYFAVDPVAQKYSLWPDADKRGEYKILHKLPSVTIATDDPSVESVKACVS